MPKRTDTGVAVDLWVSNPTVPITAPVDKIYEYVQSHAVRVGKKIQRNRGLPPNAAPENMLTPQEKAVLFLGRAIGLTYREIHNRLVEHRVAEGKKPPDSHLYERKWTEMVKRHQAVVNAIRADMVESMELSSPLVNGTLRLLFRSKLLEYFREEFMDAATVSDADERWKRLRLVYPKLRDQMEYFDKLQGSKNIAKHLGSPAEKMREQEDTRAVDEIEQAFRSGEIDDVERIARLRALKGD